MPGTRAVRSRSPSVSAWQREHPGRGTWTPFSSERIRPSIGRRKAAGTASRSDSARTPRCRRPTVRIGSFLDLLLPPLYPPTHGNLDRDDAATYHPGRLRRTGPHVFVVMPLLEGLVIP